jgi:hypothetical protein
MISLTVFIIHGNYEDHKTQTLIFVDEYDNLIKISSKSTREFKLKGEFGNKFFKLEYSRELEMKVKYFAITALVALTVLISLNPTTATAENSTTITPINGEISLKKTIIPMEIPSDNAFPWGAVRGQASETAERHPVIIQIFKGEDPVHFAQVDVKGDGSFEYKFRVRNVDSNTGEVINIFEGQYTVNIFRVIPNTDEKV